MSPAYFSASATHAQTETSFAVENVHSMFPHNLLHFFREPLHRATWQAPAHGSFTKTWPQHHNTAVPWSLRSTLCFKIPTKQMLSHHTKRDIFNLQQPSPDVRHPPKIPQNTSQKHDSRNNLTAGAAQRIQTDSRQSIWQCQIAIILEDCCWEGCKEGPCFIGQGGHSKICHSLLQLLYNFCPSQHHFSRGIGCSSWEGLLRILPARVFWWTNVLKEYWKKPVFMCAGLIDTAVTKEFVKATWSVAWHRATPRHWKQRAGKNAPAHCSGRVLLISKNSVKESGQKKCRALHKSWKTFGINMLWIFEKKQSCNMSRWNIVAKSWQVKRC